MSDNQSVHRLASFSIIVAIIIMAMKFYAWHMTGSVAFFSDALESIVNVVTSLIAWYAIGISHKPADEDHPFGHQKAEYFSAVAEGVLIVLAAFMIIREAVPALLNFKVLTFSPIGFYVNGSAAILNGLWAYLLIKAGRKARSPALVADGVHIYTDVVTSVGVLIGLVLAVQTGWFILDPIMAILVAFNILIHGWHVVFGSVQGLMDGALDPSDRDLIRETITNNAQGAIEFHDLKTRRAGTVRFAEFHLVVPATMSVSVAHDICDKIENELVEKMNGISVLIHVEPEDKSQIDAYIF
jgi:cation diffusion facilitator family transporter